MTVVYRGSTTPVRSFLSFAVSCCVHGSVLAWVILGGSGRPQAPAKSIYDQEIRPNEKKIVWYSLQEKLPEIGPADVSHDVRPPRARVKAPQIMLAGASDDARPATLIWAPEPEVAASKVIPLPNVVSVAAPKVVRPFVAPPEIQRPPAVAAPIEDAPTVADAKQRSLTIAALTDPLSGPRRAFTPPPNVRMQRQAMIQLPEGPQPQMVVDPDALPFPDAGPRPQPRAFVPPPAKPQAVASVSLPAAPDVTATGAPKAGLEKVPRGYLPRKLPTMPSAAPAISAEPATVLPVAGPSAEATLAIVGLDPAKTIQVPAPPGSRSAGFSAGPQPREQGGTGENRIALLNVPGLVVKGGARDTQPTLVANFSPTSRDNLLAAARVSMGTAPNLSSESRTARAVPPDARFAGRVVYSIAIQMPNVTSFSGSWLVWFAEREPLPGAPPRHMQPPAVVRKVDPKYIAAAAAERVEGTVRLFGVIGKDGRVGGITLVRQLDERLDRSAQEALAKWEFAPALRDGVAVDVDALFEIPFHLAPRSTQ
jgi:TonB family protein